MSVVINSSEVEAGEDALAEQYNNLRLDLLAVEANNPPIGVIEQWGGLLEGLPSGWKLCNGGALNRVTYATLFTRYGEIWGVGDGVDTFNIPDLRDLFVVGAGGDYELAETGGAETINTIHVHAGPAHTHTIPSHVHTGPAHTHTIPSHVHTGPAHIHSTSAHTHSAGSYFAMWEMVYDTGGGNYYNRVSAGFTANYKGASYASGSSASSSRSTGIQVGGSSASGGGDNTGSGGTGNTGAWNGDTGSGGTGNTGAWNGNTGSSGTENTGNGGDSAQENRPPFAGLYYIIKVL